jgi:hypothetical protein
MSCLRCGGFTTAIVDHDMEGPIALLQCVNCGDRRDGLMDYHRSLLMPPEAYRDLDPPVYDPDDFLERLQKKLTVVAGLP